MSAVRNAQISYLGLRKFATFGKFQMYFLNLILTFLKSATDFLALNINVNVKITCGT